MTINQKSTHDIIQMVNTKLDAAPVATVLDSATKKVAREALDELSKRTITTPEDKVELIALASRISILSQKSPLWAKPHTEQYVVLLAISSM